MSMMIALALLTHDGALLAQDGALPKDTAQAARLCGSAIPAIGTASADDKHSQSAFFALVAVRAAPGGAEFNVRLGEEAQTIKASQAKPDASLAAPCRKRFPLAFATTVKLPADSFRRRFACLMASAFTAGLFDGNDEALAQRYSRVNERFQGLILDSDFAANGIETREQATAVAQKALLDMVDLGHPAAIVTACEAAFPG